MPEKLTLSVYLVQRGKKAKALTKIEALVFGIPFPLQAGWPRRYGAVEITRDMVVEVERRVELKGLSAEKAPRQSAKRTVVSNAKRKSAPPAAGPALPVSRINPALFPGFVLRHAKRYRSRKSAPRA